MIVITMVTMDYVMKQCLLLHQQIMMVELVGIVIMKNLGVMLTIGVELGEILNVVVGTVEIVLVKMKVLNVVKMGAVGEMKVVNELDKPKTNPNLN
jgi:hypothetical protein